MLVYLRMDLLRLFLRAATLFHLTQLQYTDTEPNSPSTDPTMTGAWYGSHWSTNCLSHWYDLTWKNFGTSRIGTPGSSALVSLLDLMRRKHLVNAACRAKTCSNLDINRKKQTE